MTTEAYNARGEETPKQAKAREADDIKERENMVRKVVDEHYEKSEYDTNPSW